MPLPHSVQIVLDGYLADGSLLDETGDVDEPHPLYSPPPPPSHHHPYLWSECHQPSSIRVTMPAWVLVFLSSTCLVPVVIMSPILIHTRFSEVSLCGWQDVKIKSLINSSIRVTMPAQFLPSLGSTCLVPVVMSPTFIHSRYHADIVPPALTLMAWYSDLGVPIRTCGENVPYLRPCASPCRHSASGTCPWWPGTPWCTCPYLWWECSLPSSMHVVMPA